MVTVTEWQLKFLEGPGGPFYVEDLVGVMGSPPFDFEVYSFGALRWATYWFEDRGTAERSAAAASLSGFLVRVQQFPLEVDE